MEIVRQLASKIVVEITRHPALFKAANERCNRANRQMASRQSLQPHGHHDMLQGESFPWSKSQFL
jgi:hypothetical protein